MTPTDPNAPDRETLQAQWRASVAELERFVARVCAEDLIQRVGGWGMAGAGAAGMLFGLGPIGLALLFAATAILVLNWEHHHRPRDVSNQSNSPRNVRR